MCVLVTVNRSNKIVMITCLVYHIRSSTSGKHYPSTKTVHLSSSCARLARKTNLPVEYNIFIHVVVATDLCEGVGTSVSDFP